MDCPKNCPNRELVIKIDVGKDTDEIVCKHQKACEMWQEKIKELEKERDELRYLYHQANRELNSRY